VFADDVTASIPHFIRLEVCDLIEMIFRRGSLPTSRHRAVIAMIRMETIIHMAVEALGAVKPWTSANEDATCKPLRAVVTVWCAGVRRDVVIAVRTYRCDSNVDAHLGLGCGSNYSAAEYSNSN